MKFENAKRITIVGGPGSGKSTLAQRLSKRLGKPAIHLDSLFFERDWQERPYEVFFVSVSRAVDQTDWIMEGNYTRTWPMRTKRSDLIVFLDFPTPLRMFRIVRRYFQFRGLTRPDMADGCQEQLSWEFLKYSAWSYPKAKRPLALEMCEKAENSSKALRFKSPKQLEKWLTQQSTPNSSPHPRHRTWRNGGG